MSTMKALDIYLEALAMQREGISTAKIATRINDQGADHELTPVVMKRGVVVRSWHFERTGEIIRFDGQDWHYEPGGSQ